MLVLIIPRFDSIFNLRGLIVIAISSCITTLSQGWANFIVQGPHSQILRLKGLHMGSPSASTYEIP